MYEALRKGATVERVARAHQDQGLLHRADEGARRCRGASILACAAEHPAQDAARRRARTAPRRDGFADRYLAQLLHLPETQVPRGAPCSPASTQAWEGVHVSSTADSAYFYSTYNAPDKSEPADAQEGHDPGRRPQPHRPGHRVRLLLRARGVRAQEARLRDDHRQLQPRDGLDRLRHLRQALLRAAHHRGRALASTRRSSPSA